ncbi:imidazole glycerol phosphate synthase subunit HisH [Methanohalophilus sp.]|uniref:imidazole glycerol phosphate synthase subunit HisH n=1 Tax=Methanohalophilus sp. TaxID=1966352 RepID=UPI00262067D1|nr:imidazole glycerol phosphate synthase subunit HisH [Methanohalophilus sp.]MDK2891866.1 imidazole glycerol-phosphate synthase subunit HisH [Methanohalophilus sp.]
MKNIVVIDYGVGNLRSVQKGLEHAGASVTITKDPAVLVHADGLVLPGVGAFNDAMKNIVPFLDRIDQFVKSGKPMLGICLGQQMLMEHSEEGEKANGLGLIPGKVVRFPHSDLKVPHMGWNALSIVQEHPLFKGIKNGSFVYFVHSYYVKTDLSHTLASCNYGLDFAASVVNDSGNVMGTQFHPEKSGDVGLKILRNFVDMC